MSEAYTCPKCDRISYNPNDVFYGYCGNCHEFNEPLTFAEAMMTEADWIKAYESLENLCREATRNE
jgi:hypothetical protein